MRNVSDKSCRENQNTHFMFSNFSENRTVYEIMSKSVMEPERPQMTIWQLLRTEVKLHGRKHMPAPAHTPTHTHTHTHTEMYDTYCFSTATVVS